ncbi:succinate dehydrogenase assembly factor 4, mitochondrial-like [Ciona intestinalis]
MSRLLKYTLNANAQKTSITFTQRIIPAVFYSKKEIPAVPPKKPNTPKGKLDEDSTNTSSTNAYEPFPNNVNPKTGEINGPRGPEPTRYGDWERKGRVTDF